VRPLLIPTAILLCGLAASSFCLSAELGAGDALTPASAVPVLSAQSEDDLDQSVSSWVHSHYPGSRVVMFSYQYVDDNRAFLVVRMIVDASKRDLYFVTPGLPAQFIPNARQ
jgi:hypothetical protein